MKNLSINLYEVRNELSLSENNAKRHYHYTTGAVNTNIHITNQQIYGVPVDNF